ncbi:MAG: hypothetical protein ABSH47_23515 [Bryobacteraceae bacterium]|jgi:uncharacterized protein (TIGR03437 family)
MRTLCIVLTLAMAPGGYAQLIRSRGIVNSASFMDPGLPAGPIARGSIFAIFGAGLGPASSPTPVFPLSNTLGGVSVAVTQGATSVNAIPLYVSARQINAIMPSNAPLGKVSVSVTFNGVKGPPSPARVANARFGAFAINSSGFGPSVIQNFVSGPALPVNLPTVPATPNQTVILYGTGLGPVTFPDNVPPTGGNLPTQTEVFVGGLPASIGYSGRSPCCAGLDQINFQVPANAPLGCWVPVQVRTEGAAVSNTTTMAISADGSPCSDSGNALTAPFLAGRKIGVIAVLRTPVTEDVGLPAAATVTTDSIMMTFQQESTSPLPPFNPFFSLPPAGTCTAFTPQGDMFDGDPFPLSGTTGKFLDAGSSLTVSSATGNRKASRAAGNVRNFQPLGYTYDGSLVPSSLFLNPGSFTLTGAGGADVGAISTNFTFPTPLTWSNRDQISPITRSQGFTVNWTGTPAGLTVVIFGGGVDLPFNATSEFVCVAPPGSSSFAVPSTALANVPPRRGHLLQSKGVVYVGALPLASPAAFTATGLDSGAIYAGAFIGKTVIFQ